ncbi:hypothetical protein L2E82_29662 [Cichorium intybus]|uniref:Uncharacterized protein n=1 Tax=Cichorium intybus TaxID=13427 RepID=A0ACB9CY83_CICIN|nr:hypothetical protein L2E82_29662 [Cichorium intybus]
MGEVRVGHSFIHSTVVEPYTCSVVSTSSQPGPPHDCQRDAETMAANQYPANSMAPPPPPSTAYTQTEQISPFHPVVSLRKLMPVSPDVTLPISASPLPTPPPSSHRSILLSSFCSFLCFGKTHFVWSLTR